MTVYVYGVLAGEETGRGAKVRDVAVPGRWQKGPFLSPSGWFDTRPMIDLFHRDARPSDRAVILEIPARASGPVFVNEYTRVGNGWLIDRIIASPLEPFQVPPALLAPSTPDRPATAHTSGDPIVLDWSANPDDEWDTDDDQG